MKPEDIEVRLEELENKLRIVQDIHDIERLQRAYGFYLEHWMAQEIIDCFSDDPGVTLEFPEGTFLGKAGVKKSFEGMKRRVEGDPEFLHQMMQISPIIDVDPDGKTAQGRWYGFGAGAMPRGGGVSQAYVGGIYENEYVKEGGKWKIKRLRWQLVYTAKPDAGFVNPDRVASIAPDTPPMSMSTKPDILDTRNELQYPSGYIFPFHYKHPVTGEKTTEEQLNESVRRVKIE